MLKARIYRFIAASFAAVGLVVFLVLYFRNIEGNFLAALTNPGTIVTILMPFLPAAVLSWKSARFEERFIELLGGLTDDQDKK